MTKTEEVLYETIKEFIKINCYSPSVRELGRIIGYSSPNTIWKKLRTLKEKGYIDYEEGLSRTIRVVK